MAKMEDRKNNFVTTNTNYKYLYINQKTETKTLLRMILTNYINCKYSQIKQQKEKKNFVTNGINK